MTRKQALYHALQAISDEEIKTKINEIICDMPFTRWSKSTIFDTIDQFILDNKRVPTGVDFKKKGLPPHPVIKLRFGINLKDFLKKYYPVKKLCDSKDYYNKTKEEWQKIFISEYRKYKPHSAEEYNELRSKGIPSWQTVARMFGIKKWMGWIEFCDLERYATYNYKPKERPVINVSSKVDLLNK